MSIKKTTLSALTLLEGVMRSLDQSTRSAPGETPPAAILWTDADGQWQSILPQLKAVLPQLLVLGRYLPEEKQGPAIWLRCVIERSLPEVPLPEDAVPIIYMPHISRQMLRDVEGCPDSIKPLVELQYRGAVWCQRNGKDWTVEAFLVSEDGGLELDVAKDVQTKRAMLGALSQLAIAPLSHFRGKRLEAEDFDRLMIEDTPRNLLEWLNDSRGMQEKWDESSWAAFCSRCKAEYGFDPETDGELVGGEKLGLCEGAWAGVWARFAESPQLYSGIPELLQRAKPSILMFQKETWPDENSKAEDQLRKFLLQLADMNASQARDRLLQLEKEHAQRRKWVWAKMGLSPLSKAVQYLAAAAEYTRITLGGDTLEAMANLYVKEGSLADDAILQALAAAKNSADHEAVSIAARAIYLPWLQAAAEHFQKLVSASPLPNHGSPERLPVVAEPGTCILFADGLRFDIGERLRKTAEDRMFKVLRRNRWAAVPTVTATAKGAASPVSEQITGNRLNEEFVPETADSHQPLTHDRFKKMIQNAGYQYLGAGETGNPLEKNACAWTEYGELDELGHHLGIKLANRIDDQVELLIDRIEMLLTAGWSRVRVVTDHGWLLMPGGLPSCHLPKYLTESRWSRCAAIKDQAKVTVPTADWYWNSFEIFAHGPGISCFGNGNEYAHGGLSIQECLIPDLEFTVDAATPRLIVEIADLQWVGMRCRITIAPPGAAVGADIRTKVGDPNSSITSPKPADEEGKVSLLIADENLIGTTVSVVLVDTQGHVAAKRATTVGGEE